MSNQRLTDKEVAELFTHDLWNEHRYQITATTRFYEVLSRNLESGVKEGDEPALSSALVHTRSLMEFYRPASGRRHQNSVWWVTGLDSAATNVSNTDWQNLLRKVWPRIDTWLEPINVYLGHISLERRSFVLPAPEDQFGQRWPLMRFTDAATELLSAYVVLTQTYGQRGSMILDALKKVEQQVEKLRFEQPDWLNRFTW